jgi:3-hydroxyacyl-CoA dehydrogenase
MGAGIARHLAAHVDRVLLLDVNQSQLDRARDETDNPAIEFSSDFSILAETDYVIEAVYEDLAVKLDVLRRISASVSDATVIATNTSSLLVQDLSAGVTLPSRFLGVHYNNPADMNPVVEIIAGPETTRSLADQVCDWMQSTGKLAIACADTSGFILNRQSLPYINEAARCLDIAEPAVIDEIARSRLGVGLGPFAVMNLVGLPVMAAASKNLSILGKGYEPAAGLQAKASETSPAWEIEDSPAVPDSLADTVADRLLGAQLYPGKDILDAGLCAREDLHTICIEALGYNRSSPQLIESLPGNEIARLLEVYLASSGR